MGVGRVELAPKSLQPFAGITRLRNGMTARGAVDHDQRAQRRILAGLGVEARAELRIGDGDLRAGIGQ